MTTFAVKFDQHQFQTKPKELSVEQVIQQIHSIINAQSNGRIELQTRLREKWWIDFRAGNLLWASGGSHRFRRWQRLLRKFYPDIRPQDIRLGEEGLLDHWEYLMISTLVQRRQLNHEIARTMVAHGLEEVLFDIFDAAGSICKITHTTDHKSRLAQPIAILRRNPIIQKASENLALWRASGLGDVSPNWVPIITNHEKLRINTRTATYQNLCNVMQGQLSLRDLAQMTAHDLYTIGSRFFHYREQELIKFQLVADLPTPYARAVTPPPAQSTKHLPLIFCIDDSPQIGYIMEKVLLKAGYRCISLQDSVRAVGQIIRHKPCLIFLDLVMPIANGYEICKQIRRVTGFRKTPIIMLTGNDGLVDRVKAKAVGASGFIAKPIDPQKVIQTLEKQLANATAS